MKNLHLAGDGCATILVRSVDEEKPDPSTSSVVALMKNSLRIGKARHSFPGLHFYVTMSN